jgi:acetyltransferase
MGGNDVATGERLLSEAGVATFPYPDSAAHMFTELVHYSENLKSLYETPGLTPDWVRRPQRDRARQLIAQARAEGRTTLSEPESKELLDAYGIPVAETRTATSVAEAVAAADAIGPVVVKLVSPRCPTSPMWAACASTCPMRRPCGSARASSRPVSPSWRRALRGCLGAAR